MIRKRLLVSLVAFTLSWAPAIAQAETRDGGSFREQLDAEFSKTGLSVRDVARRAVNVSPDLKVKKQDLLQAAAQVDQALAAFLPSLTLSASYARLSEQDKASLGNMVVAPGSPAGPLPAGAQLVNVPLELESLSNQYALEASLLVPVSDYFLRIAPNRSAARAQYAATNLSVAATASQVATDACVTYYTWVRSRLSVVVAKQTLELSKSHLADVQQALAAGTASRADVLRVESQVASSEDYLASALDLSDISEENLRITIDAAPNEVFSLGEDMRRTLPLAPRETAAALVTRALSERPELRAYDQAERAERERASVERAGMLPRFDLFANAAYSNPNSRVFPQEDQFTGTWEAGAQLSWTISDLPGSAAAARARTEHATSIQFERQALEDRIRSEVFSAHRTLRRELGSVKTTARRLDAAEESYRVRRMLFQAGKATSVELLDAETELTRARLDALYARVDARVAAVRLNYAIGGNLARPEARAK